MTIMKFILVLSFLLCNNQYDRATAFAMDSSSTAPATKKLKMSSYLGDIEEGPPVSRKC